MPLLQEGKSLGAWGGLAWDPRRSLPVYATSFMKDLAAYISHVARKAVRQDRAATASTADHDWRLIQGPRLA
jgi:hypothetical protein